MLFWILDWIENKNKYVQIASLMDNLEKEVYYVTCYPTPLEFKAFAVVSEIEYIWINTRYVPVFGQYPASEIEKDDSMFYKEKLQKNISYQKLYLESNINFKIIDVFLPHESQLYEHCQSNKTYDRLSRMDR